MHLGISDTMRTILAATNNNLPIAALFPRALPLPALICAALVNVIPEVTHTHPHHTNSPICPTTPTTTSTASFHPRITTAAFHHNYYPHNYHPTAAATT